MNKVYKTIRERKDFVTDYVANGSFKSLKDNVKYNYSEDHAVLIRLVDYSNGFNGPFVYVDKNSYDFLFKSSLEAGDLIISNVGENVGTVFQTPDLSKPMTLGPNSILVKMVDGKKDFWYYWFCSREGQKKLHSIVSSSAQPKFNKTTFKELTVPSIESATQDKIAYSLKLLDKKIVLNNKINAELETMAKTLYDYWFVQFDFPNEKGKPYKTSDGKMAWNDELKREVPEGWKFGGLDNIGDIIGGSTPSKTNDKYFTKAGIPWITPKDLSLQQGSKFISRGELDVTPLGLKNASLKIMPKGTILLSSRAPIGYIAISRDEVTTNQGFKSLVPKKPYSTEFVYYTVQLYVDAMIQYSSGSTFSEISGSTLKMIKIVIPDTEIVKRFTKKVTSIFARQDILEKENDELSKLRDWLLPMLMNGQVTVS